MKSSLQLIASALLLSTARCSPAKMERMVVSKMRMSDLEGSATGYAYDQRQGVPVSYVQYTSHTGNDGAGYPTYTTYNTYPAYTYGDYGNADYGYGAPAAPLAPYYPGPYLEPPHVHHDQPGVYYGEPHVYHHQEQPAYHHVPVVHHHGDESDESFEEGGGAEHHAEDNSVHGEKGEKGYGGHHDYDQGENEHREVDHNEG